jgi:hypothetical protein
VESKQRYATITGATKRDVMVSKNEIESIYGLPETVKIYTPPPPTHLLVHHGRLSGNIGEVVGTSAYRMLLFLHFG